ncbi:DUF4956 domain-containing protein [Microbacterium sp. ARD31]|uniref:DUF4956 domain-containing protein n=1 Tax=Microbacterium sp. ARD31 TaxID=2962576 RepID=UPI002881C93F|nr:DUF4956 domain-containing protein [Microbacterium sp. ARD31]MDT0180194.1 DUF4956 domain-containing protein [Microbacterium sp. ARD31]
MTSTTFLLIGIDLIAAVILSLGLYYRRHHRRDLVVAFLGVNVGVMAVAAVLGTAEVALGLGLGLFGVLSIIRLRSSEISQREVAYYFAALATGLICGLPTTDPWPVVALVSLILAVLWAADHPRMLARSRHQIVRLDRAITDEDDLRTELERRLSSGSPAGAGMSGTGTPGAGTSGGGTAGAGTSGRSTSGKRTVATVTSLTVQDLDFVNDTTLVDVRYRVGGAARPAAPAATTRPTGARRGAMAGAAR